MSRKIRIKGLAETEEAFKVFMAEGLKCYPKSGLQLLCKTAMRFLHLDGLLPKQFCNQVLRSRQGNLF